MERYRAIFVAALLGVSVVSTGVGMHALIDFNEKPGLASAAPLRWPPETALARQNGRTSLLVFLHPFCPCSGATLHGISKITEDFSSKRRPDITVVFAGMAGARDTFGPIPGGTVVWDEDGREAQRFGVLKSGYTLLYSAAGDLLFR